MHSAKDLYDIACREATLTDPTAPITAFQGPYFFLSTFAPAPVYVDDIQYPTVAHGLEAARVTTASDRDRIRRCDNPGEMVRLAKTLPSLPFWDYCKFDVLRDLLQQKFDLPSLRTELLNTGTRPLNATNYWRDRFWGIYEHDGENWLGRLLMERREALKSTPPPTSHDDTLNGVLADRIQQATGLWYDLVSHDHHKDRDCHFSLTIQFSYRGERTISIEHHGYVDHAWRETARSLSHAAERLLIRICRQIAVHCAVHNDTEDERRQHCHQIYTHLTTLLTAWDLSHLLTHATVIPASSLPCLSSNRIFA